MKAGSVVGQHALVLMKEGKLVPAEITLSLLKEAMLKRAPAGSATAPRRFLIDGFPRAKDQAGELRVGKHLRAEILPIQILTIVIQQITPP